MEPVVLALKKEYRGRVEFIIADTNSRESYALIQTFGIRSIPTFIVFDSSGHPVATAVGVRTPGQLRTMIEKALKN